MAMIIIGVVVFVGLAVVVNVISTYNGLIAIKNQVEQVWANIDLILKQRFDEIPQLIQVLEQTAQYEKSVIEKVMEARTRYGSARTEGQKVQASQELSVALSGVFSIGEAYPELKSNANFTNLQSRLTSLESQLSHRREIYNDEVTTWNTRIAQFPEIFLSSLLSYREKPLFQVSENEKQRPNLKMNLGT